MDGGRVTIDLVARKEQWERAFDSVVRTCDKVVARLQTVAAHAQRALIGLGGGLAFSLREAAEAERAITSLNAALRGAGEDADAWTEKLKRSAADIQKTTVFSDDYAISLYAVAVGMGVAAEKADEMTKNAMALSAAVGGQLGVEQAMRALINADEDAIRMLTRFAPELRNAKTEAEKTAIINSLLARGFTVLEANAEDFTGTLARMWNNLKDVAEEVGNAILPTVKSLALMVKDFTPLITQWISQNSTLVATVAGIAAGGLALVAVLPMVVTLFGAAATGAKLLTGGYLNLLAIIPQIPSLLASLTQTLMTQVQVYGVARTAAMNLGGAWTSWLALINPVTIALLALAAAIWESYEATLAAQSAIDQKHDRYKRLVDVATALADAEERLRNADSPSESARAAQDKEAALRKHKEELEKELADLESRVKLVKADEDVFAIEDYYDPDKPVDPGLLDNIKQVGAELAKTTAALGDATSAKERYTQASKEAAKAEKAQRELEGSAAFKRDTSADETLAKLRLENDLLGKNAEQQARIRAERERFKDGKTGRDVGFTKQQIDAIASEARYGEQVKKSIEAEEERLNKQKQVTEQSRDRLAVIAEEIWKLRGASDAQAEIFNLAKLGAAREQVEAIANLLTQKTLLEGRKRQEDLLKDLREQAKTEEQITAEKRAQAEQAFRLGLLTRQERDTLIEKLRIQEAERRTAVFGEDLISMFGRLNKGAVAAAASGPAISEAQLKAAEKATELNKIQAETKKTIDGIAQTIEAVARSLPLVGAVGSTRR